MNALLLPSIGFPFLLAVLMLARPLARVAVKAAPWAAVPALVLALAFAVNKDSRASIEFRTLFFGAHFGLDGLGQAFLLFSSLSWLVSGLFSRRMARQQTLLWQYWFFYLLTLFGNLGAIISSDVISFYFFFTLTTLSSFGLIINARTAEARYAGRIYMYLSVLGDMLLLSGLTMASHSAHSMEIATMAAAIEKAPLRETIFALIFIGFGVKTGVVPLHAWMPRSYSAAPLPASAALGGIMTKMGIFGWMRFLPIGSYFSEHLATLMFAIGILTIIYGALIGLAQSGIKESLAYFITSQMGYLAIALGSAFVPGADFAKSVAACTTLAIQHGFVEAALFLGLGVIPSTFENKTRRRCFLFLVFLLGFSIINISILSSGNSADALWRSFSRTASLTTALAFARIIVLFSRSRPEDGAAPSRELEWPWICFAVMAIASLFAVPHLLLLSGAGSHAIALRDNAFSLPLFLVFASFLLVMTPSIWKRRSATPAIPPGDLLIPVQRARLGLRRETEKKAQAFLLLINGWWIAATASLYRKAVRSFKKFEELRMKSYAGIGLMILVWATFWLYFKGGSS